MNNNKVLVTGATGLLGPYVISSLIDKGYTDIHVLIRSGKLNAELQPFAKYLHVVKGDVQELHPLSETVEKMDYVIHVAAIVSFDPRYRQEMYNINVEGTANVVNLCLESNVKKLIHISSVAAIGRPEKQEVLSEESKWSESKYNSYYGLTKYKAELEVWRGYTEGLPMAIINPSIILGRGDYKRSSLKMIKLIQRGLSHYPTGTVGVVDVRDVADMSTNLLESDISGERYIATSASISYKDLFTQIAEYLHVKPPARKMTPWVSAVLWRLEKVRALLLGSSPIVTKETMLSAAYPAKYDTSKSRTLAGFAYRPVDESIRWACEGLLQAESGANES